MTVAAQTPFNTYVGNGVTTVFPYQFKILADGDLVVYVDGVAQILNVDYTVSGAGVDTGGSVTFISGAPASPLAVSILRAMSASRVTDYQQQGDFNSDTVNPDFDRAILLIQDLQTQLGRSIRTPADEVGTLPTLPSIALRNGKFIAFDANGQPITSSGTGADAGLRTDLASTTSGADGARLVGYRRTETNSVATAVASVLRRWIWVEDFGAVGDNVTNDYAAITAAFAAAALANPPSRNYVRTTPGKLYFIGGNALAIPDNVVFDTTGSGFRTTGATGITLGSNSYWLGLISFLTTSGGAAAAVKKTDPNSPNYCGVLGWPRITTLTGGASSVGVDYTGGYKAVWEVDVEGFMECVTGGSALATPTSYHNYFPHLRVRCIAGGTGFRARNGVNHLKLTAPQISGGAVGKYGILLEDAGAVTIDGGYVEGFINANSTRGILCALGTNNVTVTGCTFDQTTVDASTSQAIGIIDTATQIHFKNCAFGGSWGTSIRIMEKLGPGLFSFEGQAPTNHVHLQGRTTWAGGYSNGYTELGDIVASHITATASEGAGYTHQLINSSTGQGLLLQTSATSAVAGRSVLTINRQAAAGYYANFQLVGAEIGGIVMCSGSPEGVITAVPGAVAWDYTNGVQYNKKSGTGNTNWKLVTQAV